MASSVVYIDPQVHLKDAPEILAAGVAALNTPQLHDRIRGRMNAVKGFKRHLDDTIAYASFDLTLSSFYEFVLCADMACLKASFLIRMMAALKGAPAPLLTWMYSPTVLSLYTLVDVYVRACRNTEITCVHGYEPPEVLPLNEIADAFISGFGPILPEHIHETFESYISENDEKVVDFARERELVAALHHNAAVPATYELWRRRLLDAGYGEDFPDLATNTDAAADRNYARVCEALANDDNYMRLRDLVERRKQSLVDINENLRKLRTMVVYRADLTTPSQRAKSSPLMRLASRKSSTALLALQSRQGGDFVQKSVLSGYLRL